MKQTLKWPGFILLVAAAGLTLAVLATAGVRAQSPVYQAQLQATPGWIPPDLFSGPGMMGGWRSGRPGNVLTDVYPPTQTSPYSGYGPGMMGGYMGGMMGGRYRAGAWGYPNSITPLTLDKAVDAVRQYLSAYGNPDLTLTEVMEFSENYYAEVEEKSTGVHTFELLIDRYSGAVYPEPGPNMIWNTKYGHMVGMMGRWGDWTGEPMSVTPEQARDFAKGWLDRHLPGTSATEKADKFYGYYTIHTLQDGQIFGMLSVNGYTGEVWNHTWHGDFIGMKDLEE